MKQSSSIVDEIYETLKNEILNLDFKPGFLLTEQKICERFDASRTPVRSAIQKLVEGDLLEIIPYKGLKVTLLDLDLIRQFIYLRVALESNLLSDLIDSSDRFFLEDIHHQIRKQNIMFKEGFTPEEFYEADSHLHEIWFKRGECYQLWDMIQDSHAHYTRFRMLDIVEEHDYATILEEHREIYTVLGNKEKDKIKPLIHKHLMGGVVRLQHRIVGELSPYFSSIPEWVKEYTK